MDTRETLSGEVSSVLVSTQTEVIGVSAAVPSREDSQKTHRLSQRPARAWLTTAHSSEPVAQTVQ